MQHVVLVGRCVPSFSVTNRRFFKAFLEPALFSVQGMAYARSGLRKTCRQRWVACLAGTSFPPCVGSLLPQAFSSPGPKQTHWRDS